MTGSQYSDLWLSICHRLDIDASKPGALDRAASALQPHIGRGTLQRIQQRLGEPRFESIKKIAKALGCNPTELLAGVHRPEEPKTGHESTLSSAHSPPSLAHDVSHRQPIVTPKTVVWEDLVNETIEGQFLLAVKGDALMPTWPPGQMAIWQACDHTQATPGQAVLIRLPGDHFELRFLERRGASWAGVSQRVGFGELLPERDQAVVIARLRYPDLG